jgi:hypothetical protein
MDITDPRYLIHCVHHIPLITGDSGCTPVTFVGPGIKLWARDLILASSKLPFACSAPDLVNASTDSILAYAKSVDALMLQWLQGEVDSSDKLYLIQGRREPQKDKPSAPQTLRLRHYLFMVKTQKHREALTSLLMSTHLLAVEVLRYRDHMHPQIERSRRVCRFCKTEVETPEHALLVCSTSADVVALRTVFLENLFGYAPNLRRLMAELDDVEFFKAMLYERASIGLVGKFAYEVLQVFYATPVFRIDA